MRENRTYGSEGGDGERRSRPLSRRWHRNREASETRFAQTADASLSDFGTSDVAPSTGIHCNGNGNGRCAEPQATATVAARRLFHQPVRPNTLYASARA